MSVKWAQIEDTTWPVDIETDDEAADQWRLRYNNGQVSREVMLSAASVMSAYGALVDPSITQTEAIAKLKRARAAAESLFSMRKGRAA